MVDRSGVHAEAALARQPGRIEQPLFDVVQIEVLREALGSEDLCDMLAQFPDVAVRALRGIQAALAANDLAEVRRLAHAFKGTASSFGAARLATMARAMELDTVSLTAMDLLTADIRRAVDDTLTALPEVRSAILTRATL
jgi:HPt (histidine-containing phosphotransfer) domain-containing protein